MKLAAKTKIFILGNLFPFIFIAKGSILGPIFFGIKYLTVFNLVASFRFSLPKSAVPLAICYGYVCIFSIVNVLFKSSGIASLGYVFLYGLMLFIPIFLGRSSFGWTDADWENLFRTFLGLITFLNILSIMAVMLGLEFSTDIRYNPYGENTISSRGVFYTTNYGTLFSAFGLILATIFYLDSKDKTALLFLFINLIALLVYQSRAQTILAILIIGILVFSFSKKLIILLLVFIGAFAFIYWDLVVDVLYIFLRYENLLERGILGNRGLMYEAVSSGTDVIGITGIGAGNSRELWGLIDPSQTALTGLDLNNMQGLNLHSLILTSYTEMGPLGVGCVLYWPLLILYRSRNVKRKWVKEFRLLLLFCILDSMINDDFSTLASPGQSLYICVLAFLYANILKSGPGRLNKSAT